MGDWLQFGGNVYKVVSTGEPGVVSEENNTATVKLLKIYGKKSEDMVVNGSFEETFETANGQWKGSGADVKPSEDLFFDGSKSLTTTTNGSATSSGHFSLAVPLNGGNVVDKEKLYVLSLWRYSHTESVWCSMGLSTTDSASNLYKGSGGTSYGDSDANQKGLPKDRWHQIVYILTARPEENAKYAAINTRYFDGQYFDKVELFEIEAVDVVKPAAELGFVPEGTEGLDANTLTVDFMFGDAISQLPGDLTLKAYISNDSGEEVGNANINADKNAVGLIPTKSSTGYGSNVNYTAVLKAVIDGGEYEVGKVTSSLYKVVIEDIAGGGYSADGLNEARLANANKVIADGGLISVSELDNVRSGLMEKVENENAVQIKKEFSDLGIGFLVSGGGLYVGSDSTKGEGSIVYTKIAVKDNGSVELSGAAGTQAVEVLSLDSVEIEFVETMIEEAAGNGSDTALDFIPEL